MATPEKKSPMPTNLGATPNGAASPDGKGADMNGGLTDSNEDNEVALRSMIQQIAAGHSHLTEAVVGDGLQFDVVPLPLTAEQRTTYGWSKEDVASNELFQQTATKALKEISTWKEVEVAPSNPDAPRDVDMNLLSYWEKYVKVAEDNTNEACEVVEEFATVSGLVGDIAARIGLSAMSGGQDQSAKTADDLVSRTAPFVPNSLYRMQDDAQVLRCGAFKLKPNEGVFRTTNSLKAALEKTATKAIHRSVRPTGAATDQFLTFVPVDGKSVALSNHTCIDLDDMLMIHMWKNKQEGMRFQLSMLTIGNSFTQHGLGLGVFAAPLCVSVRHLCHYFTVMWLVPIVSKNPLSPPPSITAAVMNLVRKRCGADGDILDVFMGVDGRRYVLPPQGTYLPSATEAAATNPDGRPATAGGRLGASSLRSKHRRPEAVLRNKPSEDPDNQVNTATGRQMAVLKKIIGLTRQTGYTINSAPCLDGVHHEFSAEGVCIRDLRAVFYNENSWAGVGKDLKRVMMMRAAGSNAAMMDVQLGVRLAKLQNEVRNLIFAQVVGRTVKTLIENIILSTPSDMQIALVNKLITKPYLAVIERVARGEEGAAKPTDTSSYGDMSALVEGLARAVNEVATFKYPVPSNIISADRDVNFNMLEQPVPVLLAGLQMACRKLHLTLNLGDRKSITSMSSRPVMISAAVTSPPLILEKDAPISKRVSALEARFGMVDLVPADQPVMRFLTLQRACFALGVLMKSAVGCSPDDKNLIQELVEEVLPTMIRGEEESHDVTTIPYVASMFPFAVAANVTFAALNAVNTVIVSISRLYPDYSAIPLQERTVILSILRQLLIEMRRPDPNGKRRKKKSKKVRRKKEIARTPGGTALNPLEEEEWELDEPNADDGSGRVRNTNSQRKGRRHKDVLGGDGSVSRTGSQSPTSGGLLTAANVGGRSRGGGSSHDGSESEYDGLETEDDEDLDEDGHASRMVLDGDFGGGRKRASLTPEQKAAMAAARAEQERKAAEKLKELLNKAKKLDESRPSYLARLAAKRAIALAGVQDLYFGFDDELATSANSELDLNAFLANYAKNADAVAAADAAMNANNKVSTVATEAADLDALAREQAAKDAGSLFGQIQQSATFDLTSQQSVTMAASVVGKSFALGKKSMIQKATELEDEDMSYLVDDDGSDATQDKAGGGGTLTLVDVSKVFGIDANELLKNNSFVIQTITSIIPDSQTLSLPARGGKPEVIEAAAARLGLLPAAVLKHNPSFKPKDMIPPTHSLTVPLPIEGNIPVPKGGAAPAPKKSAPPAAAAAAAPVPAAAPAPVKEEPAAAKEKKDRKDKDKSPKKAAEIAAAKAADATPIKEVPALPIASPSGGDFSLSKASKKFNLDAKALLKANPDIDGTKAPISKERIISLPEQLVGMTVKEAAAQLGVSAQLVFDCNSTVLRLKALTSEVPEGSTVILPAGGEAYDGLSANVEEYLRQTGRKPSKASHSHHAAAEEAAASPSKKEKKKKSAAEEEEELSAMERDINGKEKKEKKKDKKEKDEKKDKKSKKKKGSDDDEDDQFERAMKNPVLKRLSVAYGYDPIELLRANPHLHDATENTPIHGMIALPTRSESESVASAADRLGLTPRDLLLLNPNLVPNDDVPAHFTLMVPAHPPSVSSSRSVSSNGGNFMFGTGESKIFLSDGKKFDKRLRPDQAGGLGVNISVNTGGRNDAGLDRASALLNRVSLARQSSILGASPSGAFGSPAVGKPQQLRSMNGSPTLGLSNGSFVSDGKTPLRQGSGFGTGFGGLPTNLTNRATPSPLGFNSPTSPLPVSGKSRLSSLAPVGGR